MAIKLRCRISAVSGFALVPLLAGCAGILPKAPSVSNPPTLYVWPETTCPSVAAHAGGLATPLINLIGGDAIGSLVNVLTSSLTAAAAADKAGFQATGNRAEFYSQAQVSGGAYAIAPPACYVVALTRPIDASSLAAATSAMPPITSWCGYADFAASVGDSCTVGKSEVQAISNSAGPLQAPPKTPTLALAKPEFYAEIALQSTIYALDTSGYSIVLPKVASMHYPKSLLGGAMENGKSKHLTLAIVFANPAPTAGSSTDYFKAAGVALDMFDIEPGAHLDLDRVNKNLQTGWTLVPVEKMPAGFAYLDVTGAKINGPFRPVNISANLHEVGDPSVFLQALASAFGSTSSAQGLTTALGNAVLPQGELLSTQNDSAFQSAVGKYYSAVAGYQTACATLKSDLGTASGAAKVPADRSSLTAAQFAVDSAYLATKAAVLQSPANAAPTRQSLSCPGT